MARGKNSRRRRQSRPQHQAGNNSSSDDADGYLVIGGVRINVTPQGNVAGVSNPKSRRQHRQQRPSNFTNSDSGDDVSPLEPGEMDSEDMLDYLQNIGATTTGAAGSDSDQGVHGGSEDEDVLGTSSGRRRHFEMLRRFGGVEIGDEGAPEDILGRFYDEDEDSETDSEEEDEDFSDDDDEEGDTNDGAESSSSFSSGDEDEEEEEEEEDDALMQEEDMMDLEHQEFLTLEELEQLPTATRYPVSVRPTTVLASGEKQSNGPAGGGSTKKNKRGKKGNSGKYAPGEKARLRREKIESKRAERAMVRGFDLAGINKELENFVLNQHDMHAFPPMPKHECRQVQKLAALYGCKAGAQGAGKKRSVMVVMTERTAMPEGAALLEIGRILTAHTANELRGGGKSGKGASTTIPGLWIGSTKGGQPAPPTTTRGGRGGKSGGGVDDFEIETGKGRWSDFKKKGPRNSKSTARKRQDRALDVSNSTRRKHLRPVAFVSRGTINPEDDIFELIDPGEQIIESGEEEESDVEEDAGPSILPVFEDRNGGSTPTLSASNSSGGSDDDDDGEEGEEEVIKEEALGAATLAPTSNTVVNEPMADTQEKKERKKKSKQKKKNATSVSLLSYSARGADAAEGITNSGRLLGLGMALGIGSQVFSGAVHGGNDIELDSTAEADLSPLEPMLSKTVQKKMAKQKRRAASGKIKISSAGASVDVAATVKKSTSIAGVSSSPALAPSPRQGLGASVAAGVPVSGDYGDFEAHTTGIGSKLLAKWGFAGVGSGLGRGGTGISEPLQVKMRAKGLGLGAER